MPCPYDRGITFSKRLLSMRHRSSTPSDVKTERKPFTKRYSGNEAGSVSVWPERLSSIRSAPPLNSMLLTP